MATFEKLMRGARCLLAALRERGECDPSRLQSVDFEMATQLGRKYSGHTPHNVGQTLERLAKIVSLYRLTHAPIVFSSDIDAPDPQQRSKKDISRSRLLPTDAALKALPQICRKELDAPDIVRMAVTKIKRAGPMRVNEILTLPEDCEVVYVDGVPGTVADLSNPQGEVRYGIRYFEEKTRTWNERLFPSEMVGIVRQAIAEVRFISAASRKVAQHYAANPNVAWFPSSFPDGEIVAASDVAKAFWLSRKQLNEMIQDRGFTVLPKRIERADLEAGLSRLSPSEQSSKPVGRVKQLLRSKRGAKSFTLAEISRAIRDRPILKWLKKCGIAVQPRSLRRSEIAMYILSLRLEGRPLPQPIEECLFVFPHNFFLNSQSFLPAVLMLTTDRMKIFLRGTPNIKSIFERFGFREPDGSFVKMTTAMFRRIHITTAKGKL
jgi:hypothetical protein